MLSDFERVRTQVGKEKSVKSECYRAHPLFDAVEKYALNLYEIEELAHESIDPNRAVAKNRSCFQ